MSYLFGFTGNYVPPLFALSFCHYCEHFYFYRFCSIGNERVVVEESSELRLSRGCVVINLLWLAPIAFLVALDRIEGIYGIMLAYAPLLLLVYFLNAGLPDKQDL